jgi:hypothetical protein
MTDLLKAGCIILAMVNLVIWSAVAGNISHTRQVLPSKVDVLNAAFHSKPCWI